MITFGLPIGEVARQIGVSIESIRRWEAQGRLPFVVHRTTMGWRRYSSDEVEKLRAFCDQRRASMKQNQQPK